mgnify:CR=1 FL=1
MAIRTRKKQHTTRLWLLVALLIVICAVIFLLPTSPTVQAEEGDATEQAAQDETATTTLVKFDGSSQALSSLKGKVVLVNFWATWCPPCREELKRVQQDLVERFAGEEFVFIPISRGEERETVAAFREQMGYTFAMGLDPERKIYDLFASNFIPRNFLIDKEGKVLVASVGYEPEEFDALIAKIEEELKK